MSYYLDVREERPPHAVIGQIPVPYEAAIGEMPVVEFREIVRGVVTIHRLEVHAFAECDYRILAFKMAPERLAELKEKLG